MSSRTRLNTTRQLQKGCCFANTVPTCTVRFYFMLLNTWLIHTLETLHKKWPTKLWWNSRHLAQQLTAQLCLSFWWLLHLFKVRGSKVVISKKANMHSTRHTAIEPHSERWNWLQKQSLFVWNKNSLSGYCQVSSRLAAIALPYSQNTCG